MSDSTYTVYYHVASRPFDGRTFSIMRILEHGGKPYKTLSKWEKSFKDLRLADSGFAVPMMKFPSGVCLAQTPAITIHLGKESNLSPPDWADEAKAMQLALDAADLFVQKKKLTPERQKKWLTHLQGVLEAAGSGYFVGSNLSYADFAVLFPITYLGGRPALEEYQSLAKWWDMMKKVPACQTVDATGLKILPTPGNVCKYLCGCAGKRASPGSMSEPSEIRAPKAFAEQPSYTVYYHGASAKFFGRSYAALLLLKHTGAKYQCDVPENAPSGWFAPPIVKSSSGACISQAAAIIVMLGTELGLAPTDPGEAAKAVQLACDAADVFGESKSSPKRVLKWYTYLEAVLESASSGYFMKSGLSYVDFTMLMSLEVLNTKVKVEMPNLAKWLDMMAMMPAVTTLRGKGIPIAPP